MADFRKRKAYYFWDKQIVKIATPLGKLLVNTPITPNMVTLLNLILIFPLVCLAAWFKNYIGIAILVNVYIILDFLDGGLARMKEMFSKYGAVLDTITDYLMYSVGYIFIAYAIDTHWYFIVFSMVAQWLYAIVTTVYIAPKIRKLDTFNKTKIKLFFENKLHIILGMDVSMESLLISVTIWFSFRKYLFFVCGIFWIIDLVFRLLELHILNNTKNRNKEL